MPPLNRRDPTDAPWAFPGSWAREDSVVAVCLGAVWIAVGAIVGLAGEFPLNDDFSYALSARWLAEEGVFLRTPFTYVPAVPPLLLGAGVIQLFGFSFEVLRTINFVITGLTALGAYALVRQLGSEVRWSAFAAFAFLLNPVSLSLGFTFMTDPAFQLFMVFGSVAGVEALRSGSPVAFAALVLCSVLATLTRQPGLALPIAFALAVIWQRPLQLSGWLRGAVAVALAAAALAWFQARFVSQGEALAGVDTLVWLVSSEAMVYRVAHNLVAAGCFLGAFLVPIALVRWRRESLPPMPLLWLTGCTAITVGGLLYFELKAPTLPNLVHSQGIGPLGVLDQQDRPRFGVTAFHLANVIGGAGGMLIALGFLFRQWRRLLHEPTALFLLAMAGIFLAPHLPRHPLFDRYALVLVPPVFAVLLSTRTSGPAPRWNVGIGVACVAIMAMYSIAGTRDMMARHRGIDALVTQTAELGHARDEIRGGFALRGYHHHHLREWFNPEGRTYPPSSWVPDATATVHYGTAKDAIATVTVDRWMPPGRETFSSTLVYEGLPPYVRD